MVHSELGIGHLVFFDPCVHGSMLSELGIGSPGFFDPSVHGCILFGECVNMTEFTGLQHYDMQLYQKLYVCILKMN